MQDNHRWIWIDLEMTGLNVEKDFIIEMATVITTTELDIVAEGPSLAIHQSDEKLNAMDEWNTRQHTHSGLIERVKDSSVKERSAEEQTLAFLKQYIPPGASPMCGNSICQDRRFLVKHMPELASYFHYRNLDVSSIKILANHWSPKIAKKLVKASRHLALHDIYDSIEELRFYQQHFFHVSEK